MLRCDVGAFFTVAYDSIASLNGVVASPKNVAFVSVKKHALILC